EHLHELAGGRDERRVVPDAPEKSVGAEETFAQDVTDREVLRRELLRLVERATAALRGRGLRGRTIAVKVRYPDFTTITRSRTLTSPTDTGQVVYGVVADLVEVSVPRGAAVRLLGVRIEQLVRGAVAEQLTLDGGEANWSDAERAADAARSRFGSAAVRPAALVNTGWVPALQQAHMPPETGTSIG
ncbi:MAG: DNA polymerase Y family protein, partial [Pseudonocardiaceae bacterium]